MENKPINFPQRLTTIFKGQKANTWAGDPHQHLTSKSYQDRAMCVAPGCRSISAANACDSFPQLNVTPRPEPDPEDEEEYAIWEQEYRQWRSVQCSCGNGYFCRRHAIWIPGGDVTNGLALPRDREDEGYCPDSHYEEAHEDETQTTDRDYRQQQTSGRRQTSDRHLTSRRHHSSRIGSDRPSGDSSSRHRSSRSDRPSTSIRSGQRDRTEAAGSPRSSRVSTSGSQRDSAYGSTSTFSREPARGSDDYTSNQRRGSSSRGIAGDTNQGYASNQNVYGSPPSSGRYPAAASNTPQAPQSSYQQPETYTQSSAYDSQSAPYTQQYSYPRQQRTRQSDSYGQQPVPQQRMYSQQVTTQQQYQVQQPYEQLASGQSSYGAASQPVSVQQQPTGRDSRFAQQDPRQQVSSSQEPEPEQSYPQQTSYGQQQSYAQQYYAQQQSYAQQQQPYSQQSYYYQDQNPSQSPTYASYNSQGSPQDLAERLGSVTLEEESYEQPRYEADYAPEEEQVRYSNARTPQRARRSRRDERR
ncbi:unnamed protein product [Fusarium equiseti]|uniref:Uncharacterized protein n=1 Tax=Fusarium equiseti TaxID=61235 RepID=A0A8J2ISD4_FUSEQ|nr:unnamed protein product [Fusarium equiseti]